MFSRYVKDYSIFDLLLFVSQIFIALALIIGGLAKLLSPDFFEFVTYALDTDYLLVSILFVFIVVVEITLGISIFLFFDSAIPLICAFMLYSIVVVLVFTFSTQTCLENDLCCFMRHGRALKVLLTTGHTSPSVGPVLVFGPTR